MSDTRERLAQTMIEISWASDPHPLSPDQRWRYLTGQHKHRPDSFPEVTAAYAQADLARALMERAPAGEHDRWIQCRDTIAAMLEQEVHEHIRLSWTYDSSTNAWEAPDGNSEDWVNDRKDITEKIQALTPPDAAQREPAGEPVARLHVRLEDDGLEATVQVLNGELLQPRNSPIDIYLRPPQPPTTSENPAVLEEFDERLIADMQRAYDNKQFDMSSPTPTEEPGIGPMGCALHVAIRALVSRTTRRI